MTTRAVRRCAALALVALAAAMGCARHAPSHTLPRDLLAADAERAAAMVDADAARLGAVLDDGLTYAHSNGRVDSKAALMDALASGRLDYRVIDAGRSAARVLGETGVVTGPVRIEGAAGGRVHSLRSVYTAVYWWRDGRWRLVAYHSSPDE